MSRKVRIALAQIKYFDTSKRNNVEKIKKYIRLAKKAKADIICFPESCVHKTDILHSNHKLVKEIREECKKNSIWCILTEDLRMNKLLGIRKKEYNVAMLIDRNGNIKGHYKKIHLYGDTTSPGKKVYVFKTDFAKIGIVICWDIAFPELFKEMKKKGAEIVFCPAQWWYETKEHSSQHMKREINLLESLIIARAFENIFFVAICNPVQDSKYQVSYSAIASPHRILNKIVGKEGMITAEIDLNKINKLTKIYRS